MRYDTLFQRLERARATYEGAIRGILEDAHKQDLAVDTAIAGNAPKKKRMTAKRKAALMANLAKARAAKKAKR
jgi:hypothetical protein